MKHLKLFIEAIVDWETDNIKSFYEEAKNSMNVFITFNNLKEIGDKYDIEVVDYDTFYSELPSDKMREDAPKKGQMPLFGLSNPVTHKIRIVMCVSKINSRDLDFAYHMIKHENIHVGQKKRKKSSDAPAEYLGDTKNRKEYFSNKDEIMAFAQSISDMIMDQKPNTLKDAIKLLNSNRLWNNDIKWLSYTKKIDIDIVNKYKKYIYLYLEKEFEKIGKDREIPASHFLINQKNI